MNPYLDLDKALEPTKQELRALIEGKAAIVAELDRIGGQDWNAVAEENETRFRGLVKRLKEEVVPELEKRQKAAARQQLRSSLVGEGNGNGQGQQRNGNGRSNFPTPGAPPAEQPVERDILDAESLQNYSLLRGIRNLLDGKITGFEGEVQQELEKRRDQPAKGLLLPWNLPETRNSVNARGYRERRDVQSGDWSGAVPTVLSMTMIDVLRNKMVCASLGATMLTNLVGTFAIPKKTATSSHYWVAEAVAPTASVPTVGQIAFSPETIGTYVDFTRRLVNQTSLDVEQLVRDDIIAAIAIGADLAGLNGSGSSNQPEGILQNSSVPTVAIGTNGGAIDWATVIDMETEVADDNADIGSLGYAFSPKVRGQAKQTEVFASTGRTIWSPDNSVNGYRAMASKQIPDNLTKGSSSGILSAGIFGNWADLVFGFWGAIDLILDSSSLSTTGGTRIVGLSDMDIKFRRNESFAKCIDINTAA